jgi:hypothetical protein
MASMIDVGTRCSMKLVSVGVFCASCCPVSASATARFTPSPGSREVHRAEADEERDRGDDLEVDERLEREPPDPLEVVAVPGDAQISVAKMIGAMIDLMSRRKTVENGLRSLAEKHCPVGRRTRCRGSASR